MSSPAALPADGAGRAYDARLVRRLLGYVRPYRPLVAAALVLIGAESALQLVGPLLTRWVIDVAAPAGDPGRVTLAALAFAAALLAQFGAAFGETVLTALLGQRVMRDLRDELFAHLQRLPVAFFDRTPVGRLVTRTTNDVEALNELFTAGVVAGIGDLFTLGAIGIVMLVIDWRLALAAFVAIPGIVLASRLFQRRVRVAYREIRTRLATLNAWVQERLAGMRVVQLFGQDARERARFAALNDAHLDAHLRSITVYALYFPVIEFLSTFALASLLLTGAWRVETTAGAVTVGTVAAFLQLVRRFFQPLQDLSEKFNILQGAMAASERIFALLDTPPAPGLAPTPDLDARVAALRGAGVTITFDDVWFHYEGTGGVSEDRTPAEAAAAMPAGATPPAAAGRDAASRAHEAADSAPRWVLRGVSFTARPGETIALVGHTGAGKSTIVNLLLRFHEPQRGRILLNGTDVRELPVDVLRALVGYVQQDIFLFAGDVASNVRLGAPLDDAALARAAERVGADRVIARLPGGWQHVLAERGGGISVGERQLLAFARAIAADPALLVLDEATSAVDSEIEATLQRAVATLMAGRTTIAIAHRLSTIVAADEILVLHHGVVAERGRHAALLARDGLYARLSRLQAGDLTTAPVGRAAAPDADTERDAAARDVAGESPAGDQLVGTSARSSAPPEGPPEAGAHDASRSRSRLPSARTSG